MPICHREFGRAGRAFYDLNARTVWSALATLYEERTLVDVVILGQRLRDSGQLDTVGGYAGLTAYVEQTPSAASLPYYLEIVRDKARRRELIRLATQARDLAADESADPSAMMADFAAVSETLAGRNGDLAPVAIQTLTIDDVLDYKPDPRSWLVGADMLCRGEFSILAGLPEAGKSMLANTLAVAGSQGRGEWMGYEIRRRFKTLVLQSEGSQRRLQKELAHAHREQLRDYVKFTPPTHIQFGQPEFRRALRQIHDDWPFDLLIVDNWSDVVADDKFADHQLAFDQMRASLPAGEEMPAVLIVAHLSKAVMRSERPLTGRALMAHVAGSFRIGQKARTCFTLVRAFPEEANDDTVIFDCGKASNDHPLPAAAYHRKPLAFAPAKDFDFQAWLNPPDNQKRGGPSAEQLDELFDGGRRTVRKATAAKELESLGFSRASVYRYLDEERGPFAEQLTNTDGLLTWTPKPKE